MGGRHGPGAGGLSVAIVGGGLGGLCLAQGLHKCGRDVTVYEADPALAARTQGYRLHLDARAGLALDGCLPVELFDLFLATCSEPSRRFSVLDHRLRVLRQTPVASGRDPFAPHSLATSADRQTLREVLASGLEDRLVLGARLSTFEADGTGVRLHLADGREADADVLVGADGVGSTVRRQRLPQAEAVDTGSRVVYGRTPLTDGTEPLLPPPLLEGFTAVVGGRVGMATGLVRFRHRPDEAAARVPGAVLSPGEDYLMWAVAADGAGFGVPDDHLTALDAAGLHDLATSTIGTWHEDLRTLVALADVDRTFLVRVRTSTPTPAWAPSRVTLLGDAIHAMSPAGGSGANTALQDATRLCDALSAVPAGRGGLLDAIGRYEADLRDRGYAAMAASRQAEARIGARAGGLTGWLQRRLRGSR